jgi:hypothetical protein
VAARSSEADPAEVVEHERYDGLAGEDDGDEGRGAQLGRRGDAPEDVEGAEQPGPPIPTMARPGGASRFGKPRKATNVTASSADVPTANETNAARTGLSSHSASCALTPAWIGSIAPAASAKRIANAIGTSRLSDSGRNLLRLGCGRVVRSGHVPGTGPRPWPERTWPSRAGRRQARSRPVRFEPGWRGTCPKRTCQGDRPGTCGGARHVSEADLSGGQAPGHGRFGQVPGLAGLGRRVRRWCVG